MILTKCRKALTLSLASYLASFPASYRKLCIGMMVVGLGGVGTVAWAEQLASPLPEDFAYGAELIVPTRLPLQSFSLPKQFYRQQVLDNSGDLRVYNAEGTAVAIDRQVFDDIDSEAQLHALNLFPLMATELSDTAGLQLAINRDAGRTEIQLSEDAASVEQSNLVAYVVALPENWLSAQRPRLRGIRFQWQEPMQGFIEQLKIETSDDLLHWRSWIDNESLSRLTWNEQQIGKSRIDISASQRNRAQRYWRISWKAGQVVDITDLQLVLQDALQHDDQTWQSVNGQWLAVENAQTVLEFHNRDRLPVSGFKFKPNSGNGFLSGRVYSRSSERQEWRYQGTLNQYHLELDGAKQVSSSPLIVKPRRDEWWRLELAPGLSADQLKQWHASMGWTPQRVTFVREGSEPFLLAWGNPNVGYVNSDLSGLYDALTEKQRRQLMKRKVRIGKYKTLGGEIKLQPPMPFGWPQVALWSSLLLGVVALFYMARSLYRQMAVEKV